MPTKTTHPTKQQVREWMESRQVEHEPPPTPEEVRKQLGWDLIPENKRPVRERGE